MSSQLDSDGAMVVIFGLSSGPPVVLVPTTVVCDRDRVAEFDNPAVTVRIMLPEGHSDCTRGPCGGLRAKTGRAFSA
jgi:hypothetical protein